MAEEIKEGVAYLMALKQSASPQDASAGIPETSSGETAPAAATVGERFEGAEKRRSARYKCEGSAQVREENCDIHTWVTFTDISLHGCYVEAQATYPAGTVLSMKMETNGIRLETKGIVRVSYPYLGMGIAFAEMSEENVETLKRLLSTISRPTVIMGPGIASSLPAVEPLKLPPIMKPDAAISALVEFFESRQMLMREEFARILKKSQAADTPR
ncbi:MAG: PilZ domain-containing protein [Candidatus Sulfotelmatobacter sp.]